MASVVLKFLPPMPSLTTEVTPKFPCTCGETAEQTALQGSMLSSFLTVCGWLKRQGYTVNECLIQRKMDLSNSLFPGPRKVSQKVDNNILLLLFV